MGVKVFYEHGQVVKVLPPPSTEYYKIRELINEATNIVSDGIAYDLTNRESIYSIEIPEYVSLHENHNSCNLGVTGYLEYVLRMHAGLLWNELRYDLAIPCLAKATQLMLYSTVGWQRKDFYRIVDWNIELGRFKKAQEWKEWIEKYTPSEEDVIQERFNQTIESCKFLGTDLVEVGDLNACCEICAKYRKRIYSLNGKDFRFPKFPKDFHMGCGLHISPFVDGVMEPSFNSKHYIIYSRRPFRDDRSIEEKESYKKRLEMLEASKYKERIADLNHIIYYWFKPKFPDDFPKSISAFSRMRNSNSKKYQELIKKIEAAGYQIPKSLEEVAELE